MLQLFVIHLFPALIAGIIAYSTYRLSKVLINGWAGAFLVFAVQAVVIAGLSSKLLYESCSNTAISYIRESIHLVNLAGKTPLDEFNKTAIEAFQKLLEDIENEILEVLERAHITKDGIDMEKEGLKAPTSTWTYLINDRPEQLGINPIVTNPIVSSIMWPLMMLTAIFHRFFRKVEKIE